MPSLYEGSAVLQPVKGTHAVKGKRIAKAIPDSFPGRETIIAGLQEAALVPWTATLNEIGNARTITSDVDIAAGAIVDQQVDVTGNCRHIVIGPMQAAAAGVGGRARPSPVVAWLIAVFGLAFFLLGVGAGVLHQRDLAIYTGRATGTVVDYVVPRSASGSLSTGRKYGFAPVVQFRANGELQQFTSTLATSPPRFKLGEQVMVAYDVANPSHATIDSFQDSWQIPLIFGGAGLLFLVLGVLAAKGRFFQRAT